MLDCIADQFRIALEFEFLEYPDPVCTDRIRAEQQFLGDIRDRLA